MPKFSIIVPVYNGQKHLKKCIDSILNQTMDDFELIIVNDGSEDKSLYICNEYLKIDDRLVVIDKQNGGVSSARNAGLENAKGEFICFIDSDDYVENNYLENLYKTNVDMVICNINFINVPLKSKYILNTKKIGKFIIEESLIDNLIESRYISTIYSKMYKRNIIDKNNIRFDENVSLGEDTMFVVDYISCIDNIYISEIPIYNYIDYGTESLSKFNKEKFHMLEKANKYISMKLSTIYNANNSLPLKNRIWSNYEWAIFEIINSNNMNILNKINMLKYIFKNDIYISLSKDIDIYMKKHSKKVRYILSTRNVLIVIGFFNLSKIKNKLYKFRGN